jgi:hypothetical protein
MDASTCVLVRDIELQLGALLLRAHPCVETEHSALLVALCLFSPASAVQIILGQQRGWSGLKYADLQDSTFRSARRANFKNYVPEKTATWPFRCGSWVNAQSRSIPNLILPKPLRSQPVPTSYTPSPTVFAIARA